MASNEQPLFEKWISAKFEAKVVLSASKKGQYTNVRLSVINGREYSTKLGRAMSLQLGNNDIDEMIQALVEIKENHVVRFTPSSSGQF
ncbi:MAG: hypothetical protein ACTSUE_03440 [Promethearchaeota archaeon]